MHLGFSGLPTDTMCIKFTAMGPSRPGYTLSNCCSCYAAPTTCYNNKLPKADHPSTEQSAQAAHCKTVDLTEYTYLCAMRCRLPASAMHSGLSGLPTDTMCIKFTAMGPSRPGYMLSSCCSCLLKCACDLSREGLFSHKTCSTQKQPAWTVGELLVVDVRHLLQVLVRSCVRLVPEGVVEPHARSQSDILQSATLTCFIGDRSSRKSLSPFGSWSSRVSSSRCTVPGPSCRPCSWPCSRNSMRRRSRKAAGRR
jgi:hypothetical protein